MAFWFRLFYRAMRDFFTNRSTTTAAAISYYVLLSLFPLLIFLFAILGMFLKDRTLQNDIVEGVVQIIPSTGNRDDNIIVNSVRGLSSVGAVPGTLGIALMAWSGAGMFRVIRRAIDTAYDQRVKRSILSIVFIDLFMMFAVGLFFLLSIGASAFILNIRQFMSHWGALHDSQIANMVVGDSGLFWKITSHAVPFILSMLAFYLIYWIVPGSTRPARHMWTGAIVASALFEITKTGLVYYLKHFNRYNLVFGSLGAVIAFLFAVYLASLILLFGAEVISAFPTKNAKRH